MTQVRRDSSKTTRFLDSGRCTEIEGADSGEYGLDDFEVLGDH